MSEQSTTDLQGSQISRRRFWTRKRMARVVLFFALLFTAGYVILEAALRLLPFDDSRLRQLQISTVVRDNRGVVLRAYLAADDRWCFPAELKEISPLLIKATLAAEDKRFYTHQGIDWLAVIRAAYENVSSRQIISGASTISMQVAGFAIDSRERTFTRKFKQAFTALQLERHWSKERILECYLTHASYGGNICGVEAAALRYFNKSARDLTPGQATLLAGLPQSPERFRPDRYMDAALIRRDFVLEQLTREGELSADEADRIRTMALQVQAFKVPASAPHYCDYVRARYPGRRNLHTTLDSTIQFRAEQLLHKMVAKHRSAGLTNGCVIVLENETGNVTAMVGSADYWNKFDDGQVNGALGYRSPGSALKPLFYARALDKGQLAPGETLFDVPVSYAGYSPQNYDREFRGPVNADRALAWSLNIPAMEILHRVGVDEFRGLLKRNGVPLKFSRYGDPGLSMAIGTCAVRPLDLTRAYASLGADGKLKPLRWLQDEKPGEGKSWISPTASRMVLDVLADENLRSPRELDASLAGIRGVAWKTGTSNGHRDAWTIAVTKDYTVGVWMGNMNGSASRALVGSQVAAPIALELANALKRNQSVTWPDAHRFLEETRVCAMTGLQPGVHCHEQRTGYVMPAHKDTQICQAHRSIEIAGTGYELCTRCSTGHEITHKVCLEVAPAASNWLRRVGHLWASQLKPAHNPECQVAAYGAGPSIVLPARGEEFVVLSELPAEDQKITLLARTGDPSEVLYWFVNGNLAGTSRADQEVSIPAQPGRHTLKCTDARGKSSETWFAVQRSEQVEEAVKWSRLSDSN